jgi:hypothetical protein
MGLEDVSSPIRQRGATAASGSWDTAWTVCVLCVVRLTCTVSMDPLIARRVPSHRELYERDPYVSTVYTS